MSDYLYEEFSRYYAEHRCQGAPESPRRVYGLAQSVFRDGRYRGRLTAADFVDLVYAALTVLFEQFDPTKYTGDLPPDDHFVNLFKRSLVANLQRSLRTDQGRPGCRAKFRPQPAMGLLSETSLSDEWARQKVRELVNELPEDERPVVIAKYWDDMKHHEIGQLLKIATKTVKRRHDRAIGRLKDDLAA